MCVDISYIIPRAAGQRQDDGLVRLNINVIGNHDRNTHRTGPDRHSHRPRTGNAVVRSLDCCTTKTVIQGKTRLWNRIDIDRDIVRTGIFGRTRQCRSKDHLR